MTSGIGGPNGPMGTNNLGFNQPVSSTDTSSSNLISQALNSSNGSVSIPVGEAKNMLAFVLQGLSANTSLSFDQILQNINNGSMPSQDDLSQLNQIEINFTYNDGLPVNKNNWITSSVDNEPINLNIKPTDSQASINFQAQLAKLQQQSLRAPGN